MRRFPPFIIHLLFWRGLFGRDADIPCYTSSVLQTLVENFYDPQREVDFIYGELEAEYENDSSGIAAYASRLKTARAFECITLRYIDALLRPYFEQRGGVAYFARRADESAWLSAAEEANFKETLRELIAQMKMNSRFDLRKIDLNIIKVDKTGRETYAKTQPSSSQPHSTQFQTSEKQTHLQHHTQQDKEQPYKWILVRQFLKIDKYSRMENFYFFAMEMERTLTQHELLETRFGYFVNATIIQNAKAGEPQIVWKTEKQGREQS